MIQDVAIKQGNIDVDVVTNALARSTMRIMGPKYMTAGMGDAGPCHPRDNIALRYLAETLDLGYDLFDVIMKAREQQAKNMARFVRDWAVNSGYENSVYIHGKAYKPNVEYLDGSYSLLVGYYCEELGHKPTYVDPLTGDNIEAIRGVVLLAHSSSTTYKYTNTKHVDNLYCRILSGSVIVDPWRKFESSEFKVIHYGNTR